MSDTLSVADALRELELVKLKKQWKEYKNPDILENIWSTRGCFQPNCSQWNDTSMNEKIDLLKELINDKNFSTLELALNMREIGNVKFNKSIKEKDIIMGMSQLIDFLLKNKK
jgi:hypothetical protein